MTNLELNSALEARHLADLKIRNNQEVLADVKDNVAKLEALVDEQADPDWQGLALGLITRLADPVNGLLLSWNDWWLAHNALGHPTEWDPEHNAHHMVRSEVSDIYKAMTTIRMLENKLSREPKNSGTTNFDWNLLNSLKREVGIPVEFANEKQALKGDGSVNAKAVAANM